RAVFVPRPTTENLKAAADYLVPTPDVKIEAADGTEIPTLNVVPRWDYEIDGMFQYIHKVKNGMDVYLFANSSNRDAEFTATLRGTFKSLELWDPITGETAPVAPEKIAVDEANGTTAVKLALKSIQSVFVVGER
ncbi:MAG: hypothetical protein II655_00175, partial [Thermoguttaceae bacterium]|nr:hypothetical protein [Thermoguttaceae bacterium]